MVDKLNVRTAAKSSQKPKLPNSLTNAVVVNVTPFNPSCSQTPEAKITIAVIVHTTIVSMNGSIMATRPSRTGSLVMAAPWAISDVPKPASFEKSALRIPAIITAPTAPPMTASPVNASCNINPNNDGISARWLNTTNRPANKYNTTITGTIYVATRPILLIPPKITNDVIKAMMSPWIRFPVCSDSINHPLGIKT